MRINLFFKLNLFSAIFFIAWFDDFRNVKSGLEFGWTKKKYLSDLIKYVVLGQCHRLNPMLKHRAEASNGTKNKNIPTL